MTGNTKTNNRPGEASAPLACSEAAELAAVKCLGALLEAQANHAPDEALVLLHRAWRSAEASVDFFRFGEPAQNAKVTDRPE